MYTERMRELFIWPGEEKTKRASNYYLRYLIRVIGETRLFSQFHNKRTKGNSHK